MHDALAETGTPAPASWRHRLYAAGFGAMAASGANAALRPIFRGRGLILTLHHVRPWTPRDFAPNRFLEVTPDFLEGTIRSVRAAGFDFVDLDEVACRLRQSRGRRFAAVTFDDGYRDNIAHASPVLQRHGVPWTLYAVPDFLDGRGRLWWLELERAIAASDALDVVLGGEEIRLPVATPAQKAAAHGRIARRLKSGTARELEQTLASLHRAPGCAPGALVREMCASWDEIAALSRDPLVTIGAHTLSHPVLSRLSEDEAAREIAGSKEVLEARLARPVRHFAFPHGDADAAGPRERRLAAEADFVSAVTTRPGHLWSRHRDRMTGLPRVSLNGLHQTQAALDGILSGVPFLASRFALR